jgi:aminoglycoside phosphotransferase (APT) family kinase protein
MDVEMGIADLTARLAPLEVGDLAPLPGGASSLTYRGRRDTGERVVVKVAPAGVPPVRNRDVLRQARLLRALAPTAVPVPAVLWEDAGAPPAIPPLFVMTHVDGVSLEPLFDPGGMGGDEAVVADRLRHAAEVMASLHALDVSAFALDEPTVGPLEELERWCRLLETVDPALAPGWESAGSDLRDAAPLGVIGTLVHGDFRLGNLLAIGATIAAVIDWEIWSIGDPRIDVGWFLVNADPATYGRPTRYAGHLPDRDELVDVYSGVLGHTLPELGWFEALACFKAVATWSAIIKHDRRRPQVTPEIQNVAPALPSLLARTRELLR